MSDRTLVLLQIDPGHAQEAVRHMASLPGVTEAVMTSGPYDVIATVEGDSEDVRHVLAQARRAPGLCVLRLCPSGVRETTPASRDADRGLLA